MAENIIDPATLIKKVFDLNDRTSFALPYKGFSILFKGGIYVTDNEEHQEAITNWIKQTGKVFATIEDYDETNPKHNPTWERVSQSSHIVNGMIHSGSYGQPNAQPQVTTGNQLFDALTAGTLDTITAENSDAQTLADLGFVPNGAPAAPTVKPAIGGTKK